MAKGPGKPTYLKSVAARVGLGDGYDYFPGKGKVSGGPASPFGRNSTRQQQLDRQEAAAMGAKRDNQTTDSNNR